MSLFCRWFFEHLSQEDAETFLTGQPPGSFIVRTTASEPNQRKLTVRPPGLLIHYNITERDGQFSISSKGPQLKSVSELISYYKFNPIEDLSPSTLLKCYPSRMKLFSMAEWDIHPSEIFYEAGEEEMKRLSFSRVVQATWRDNQKVLVEVMNDALSKQDMVDIEKKVELLASLQHDRIVRLLAVCWYRKPLSIVTEFPDGGDLPTYMRTSSVEPRSRWVMISHICSAMEYLEDIGIVHKDLTSSNCMVTTDPDLGVKVTGFDSAKRTSDETSGRRFIGGAEETSSKTDVYYFGIIMYEVSTAFVESFSKDKMHPGATYQPERAMPEEQYGLMQECWRRRKDDRPSFAQIFSRMQILGLCKSESYYSEIKQFMKEKGDTADEKVRAKYSPSVQQVPQLPLARESSKPHLNTSTEMPATPIVRERISSAHEATRQKSPHSATVHRSASEVIPSTRSRKATFFVPDDSQSDSQYVTFEMSQELADLRSKFSESQKTVEKQREDIDHLENIHDKYKNILKLKTIECNYLKDIKVEWEDYEKSLKPLPLIQTDVEQTLQFYNDGPCEAPILQFSVDRRGGTYISAVMNVAISVPRGALSSRETITVACKYFNCNKGKINVSWPNAIIASSVYELSPSASQCVFKKRVQVTLPHGVVLETLGEKFQMKVIHATQVNDKPTDDINWEEVPSHECAFATDYVVVRVNHFSLLAIIVVHTIIELVHKTLHVSDQTTEQVGDVSFGTESVQRGRSGGQSQQISLFPGPGVHLRYHAAVFGHTSGETMGQSTLQKFYIYCYYGIPEYTKLIREQEGHRHPHSALWAIGPVSAIDPENQSVAVKIVSRNGQILFAPACQNLGPEQLNPISSPVPITVEATFESGANVRDVGICPSSNWCGYTSGELIFLFDLNSSQSETQAGQSVSHGEMGVATGFTITGTPQDLSIVNAAGPVVAGSNPTLVHHTTIQYNSFFGKTTMPSPTSSVQSPLTPTIQLSHDETGAASEGSDLYPIPLLLAKKLAQALDTMMELHNDWRYLAINLGISPYQVRQLEKMATSSISEIPSPTMTVLRSWIQKAGHTEVNMGALYKAVRAIDPPCVSALKSFDDYLRFD